NAPMLEAARAKFAPSEQVVFRTADATELPFDADRFDVVVCQFGLMFFPDKARAYREAHRVLAPGGRYLLSVWDSCHHNRFGRIGRDVSARFFPTDPPTFYGVPFSCHEIDPIKEGLLEAGFSDVTIAVVQREKAVGDFARFGHALIYGSPLVEQIRARGGVTPERIVGGVTHGLQCEFGGTAGPMPMQAIVFSATRPL